MVWWEEELCERIAAGGRFVIRYDQRDVGPLDHLPPRRPGLRDERPGRRRRRHPRRPRGRAGPRRRTLDVGRHGALPRRRPPRAGRVGDLHEHDDQRRRTPLPDTEFGGGDGRRGSRPVRHRGVRRVRRRRWSWPTTAPPPWPTWSTSGAWPALDVARTRDLAASHDEPLRDGLRRPAAAAGSATSRARRSSSTARSTRPSRVEHGEALRAAVPGATLVVLEDAGHELPVARWDRSSSAALLAHTAPATQEVAR